MGMVVRGKIRRCAWGFISTLKVKGMVLHGKSIPFAAQKVTFRMAKGNLLLYKKNVLVV